MEKRDHCRICRYCATPLPWRSPTRDGPPKQRIKCICLRTGNRTCFLQLFELAHMFDATQHLGLGWGVITFLNLNTRRCYATSGLAHMFDATQHLGLHTCSMLRNIWACTHAQCYATSGLAHMFDATQHLGLHTWLLLRNTMGWGGVGCWGGVGMMMFFGLAHMLDATELLMFFRFAHMLDATQPRKRKAPV